MPRRQVQISLPDHLDAGFRATHISLSRFVQDALEEYLGRQDIGLEQQEKEALQKVSELQSALAIQKASLKSIQEERSKKQEEIQAREEAEKLKELQCKKCGDTLTEDLKIKFAGFCKNCFHAGGYREALKKDSQGKPAESAAGFEVKVS